MIRLNASCNFDLSNNSLLDLALNSKTEPNDLNALDREFDLQSLTSCTCIIERTVRFIYVNNVSGPTKIALIMNYSGKF